MVSGATHHVEEAVDVSDQVRRNADAVQIHHQVRQPNMLTELLPCLVTARQLRTHLLDLVFGLYAGDEFALEATRLDIFGHRRLLFINLIVWRLAVDLRHLVAHHLVRVDRVRASEVCMSEGLVANCIQHMLMTKSLVVVSHQLLLICELLRCLGLRRLITFCEESWALLDDSLSHLNQRRRPVRTGGRECVDALIDGQISKPGSQLFCQLLV